MPNWIQSAVSGLLLERPGQKLSLDAHAVQLEREGQRLVALYAQHGDSPANREKLRHVIGIERWGQSRLRVFLDAPLQHDEHDAYRPDADHDWDTLRDTFQAARAETVALVHELAQHDLDKTVTVPHNQYGKLTAFAWLRYLSLHTNMESKRLK